MTTTMPISTPATAAQAPFDLRALLRSNIRTIKPYSSARSEFSGTAEVFLDANENPFGSPTNMPIANGASQAANAYNRYPDPLQTQVKARLAAVKGVEAEQLFLGNGSDEVIDLLIRAFCEPVHDSILITPPTYGMYEVSADIQNAHVIRVPLLLDGERYAIDVERVLAAVTPHTKLMFLCSPNNPTGNTFPTTVLHEIIHRFRGVVLVDEAYIDFAPDHTLIHDVQRFPNLVVMQTLSKAWGLAGLRLGILVASPEMVRVLNSIKPPYNINTLTQQHVLQALEHTDWKERVLHTTLQERERLAAELPNLQCVQHVFPSDANFLLVRVTKPRELYTALTQAGIIVRDRSAVPLCEGCLRITVGTPDENTTLLEIMRSFA
jgi:histidinol-phosphate aminotransferase